MTTKVKKAKFGKFSFRNGIYLMNEGGDMELVYINKTGKDWWISDYPNMIASVPVGDLFFENNKFFYISK